jgi:hybrid polyketide synthase/nonribosomal peptide synthetase ACE1
LESYQPPTAGTVESGDPNSGPFTPYTFSAVSEVSLVAVLQAYSKHLKALSDIKSRDLAWTLQSCRTSFAIKASFSAMTIERLVSKIDEKLAAAKQNATSNIGVRSSPAAPSILGIFTGQGAQWATMGGHLIRSSAFVREKLAHLETSLATLPPSDRPKWRLENEILANATISRVAQAELSQPLCTAIQIVLVDILRSAGITFEAVVGHSSGEIAAAYAADFISAHDAIRIAYYRGLHAQLAGGPNGQKGAMLAVGTSLEDAQELIELPTFKGHLKIAAHNSDASVTLSGNADAIMQAKEIFDEEKKFARVLKVDTAYHSHHMLPCSEPYMQSIRACKIQVNRERNTSCSWYSSVNPGQAMEPIAELQDVYWRDNMTNAVLFADAVQKAANDKLNLVLEVGPHPSLQGPATQNISDVRSALPYCGVLTRGDNDIEAFSNALGFVWNHFGAGGVDFQSFESLMSAGPPPKLAIGLPLYQWNRGRVHWHESRKSRKIRGRADAFHELLGIASPDATDRDQRWTNLLKASEIPWLDGHALQGQTVFPAAGYVAMALEAAKKLAGDGKLLFRTSISSAILYLELPAGVYFPTFAFPSTRTCSFDLEIYEIGILTLRFRQYRSRQAFRSS